MREFNRQQYQQMQKQKIGSTDTANPCVSNQQHIFINQMKEQRRICQNNQDQSPTRLIFSLRTTNKDAKSKLNLRVDFSILDDCFSETYDQQAQCNDKVRTAQFLPEFSYSKGSQMRAFFTPNEKTTFQQENNKILEHLTKKANPDKSNYRMMRPTPVSTYCQICKEPFENYLKHTEHATHKRKLMQQSKSTKMIDDMISSFELSTKRTRSEKLVRIDDEDDEQLMCMNQSSKIRIIQTDVTLTPMRINTSKSLSYQNQTKNLSSSTNIGSRVKEQSFSNNLLPLN